MDEIQSSLKETNEDQGRSDSSIEKSTSPAPSNDEDEGEGDTTLKLEKVLAKRVGFRNREPLNTISPNKQGEGVHIVNIILIAHNVGISMTTLGIWHWS